VKLETRPDGSVVVRAPGSLRFVLLLLGAAVLAAVLAQEPREVGRVSLGVLGSLLPFTLAAVLEQASFHFDPTQRRLRWSRRSLFRALAGEIPFDEISAVSVRVRFETDTDSRRGRRRPAYQVVLGTSAGEIPLWNAWVGDERGPARAAEAIRALLGHAPAAPAPASIEALVASGQLVDAVKLARAQLGLSLEQAKRHVEGLQGGPRGLRAR
jgi:hypothetical protein